MTLKRGRKPNPIKTIAKIFKITPEQDKMINKIVAKNYPKGNKVQDRSHFVRLAIEARIDEFYSKL